MPIGEAEKHLVHREEFGKWSENNHICASNYRGSGSKWMRNQRVVVSLAQRKCEAGRDAEQWQVDYALAGETNRSTRPKIRIENADQDSERDGISSGGNSAFHGVAGGSGSEWIE